MRSLARVIPVVSVALMMFSLPVLADKVSTVQYGERGSVVQVERVDILNYGDIVCFPFICG